MLCPSRLGHLPGGKALLSKKCIMKIPPNSAVYTENKLTPIITEHDAIAINKGSISKKIEELPGLMETEAHFVYDFTLEGNEVKKERNIT